MICKGEKFFISKANRVDILAESVEILKDGRGFYFIHDFFADNGYDFTDFVDYAYDFDNSRVCGYMLTDEYLEIYSKESDLYDIHAIPLPTENTLIRLPDGVDAEKYNLSNLFEPVHLDKVLYDFQSGYICYYVRVFSDYGVR